MEKDKDIEITVLSGEIEIRGRKIRVYPLPMRAIIPIFKGSNRDKVPEELILSLIDNVYLCCDLTKEEIKGLKESEKIDIVEKAIELDPEILKKSLQVLKKLGQIA